jgi:hypothetical protein
MSREWDQGRTPSQKSNYQQQNIGTLGVSTDLDIIRHGQIEAHPSNQGRFPYSAPPTSTSRIPDRPNLPTRSSTVGTSDPDRNLSANILYPKTRSEDLNHTSISNYNPDSFSAPSPRLSPAFPSSAGSRPSTPGGSSQSKQPSSSSHSDHSPQASLAYYSSTQYEESSTNTTVSKAPRTSSTSTSIASTYVFSNLLFFPSVKIPHTYQHLDPTFHTHSLDYVRRVEKQCRDLLFERWVQYFI